MRKNLSEHGRQAYSECAISIIIAESTHQPLDMDKKEPASSTKSKIEWRKGFLHEGKGKGTVPSLHQEQKEPPITMQGGLPQGLGLSPSVYYKLLESKEIAVLPVTLLQVNFKGLAKEAKEADNNDEDAPIKDYIELLKRAEENVHQSGKELKESFTSNYKPREDGGQSSQGSGSSPTPYYKVLGSSGINGAKLLKVNFKDLVKEDEEADNDEDTGRLLKKFKATLSQLGKELRDQHKKEDGGHV